MIYPMTLHEAFKAALDDPATSVAYIPYERLFLVLGVLTCRIPNWAEEIAMDRAWGRELEFCPWSGELLPPNLCWQREDVAWREHGMDLYAFEGFVPEEMYSDKWWRSRIPNNPKWDQPRLPRECDDLWIGLEGEEDVPYIPAVEPSYPGRTRFPERPPHLCGDMDFFLRPYTLYAYLPWAREYGFRIIDPERPIEFQPMRVRAVVYCPFCGRKLPSNLRKEWTARVRGLGLSPADTTPEERAPLPLELVTDTWWKEAGL